MVGDQPSVKIKTAKPESRANDSPSLAGVVAGRIGDRMLLGDRATPRETQTELWIAEDRREINASERWPKNAYPTPLPDDSIPSATETFRHDARGVA